MERAFTLAEVLITLGIIGIVAALTIPTLIGDYRNKEKSVRLKKAYSELSQAIVLSQQEHGDITGWEWAPYHKEGMLEWSNEYIFKYMKKISACEDDSPDKKCPTSTTQICNPASNVCHTTDLQATIYMLNNGQNIYIYGGGTPADEKTNWIHILVDTNGIQSPNMYGKDIFVFLLSLSTNNKGFPLKPFGAGNNDYNRAYLLRSCTNDPAYCSALLQYDNWEFKDDYPW